MVIVIVMTIIHAHLAHPDHPAPLVPMAITVQMAKKEKQVLKVTAKDLNIRLANRVAYNARLDPKERTDPLEKLEMLARKVFLVAKVRMANPAVPDQLVDLAMAALQVATENQDLKEHQAPMPKVEPKAHPVPLETKARLVQLEETPIKDPQANLELQEGLDQVDHQAKEAKMVEKDNLAHLVPLENPDPMLIIAHAQDVPKPNNNNPQQFQSGHPKSDKVDNNFQNTHYLKFVVITLIAKLGPK